MKLYLLVELLTIVQSYHIYHHFPKHTTNKINRQKSIINNNNHNPFSTVLSKLSLFKDDSSSVELELLQNTDNSNSNKYNNNHQFIFKIFDDDDTKDLSKQNSRISSPAPTPTTSSPMSQAATRILAQELVYTQLEPSAY